MTEDWSKNWKIQFNPKLLNGNKIIQSEINSLFFLVSLETWKCIFKLIKRWG